MLISGYNKTERDIIVGEGVGRCNNLIAKVNKGHRPIYRISARKKYDRAVQKILKKKKQYGEQTETVVFVQATPREVLKKAVELEAKGVGLNIIYFEVFMNCGTEV